MGSLNGSSIAPVASEVWWRPFQGITAFSTENDRNLPMDFSQVNQCRLQNGGSLAYLPKYSNMAPFYIPQCHRAITGGREYQQPLWASEELDAVNGVWMRLKLFEQSWNEFKIIEMILIITFIIMTSTSKLNKLQADSTGYNHTMGSISTREGTAYWPWIP